MTARPSGPIPTGLGATGPRRQGSPTRLLLDAGTELARVLLPVACPGCGRLDVRWCDDCAAPFATMPVRVESGVPRLDRLDGVAPLPVWALARYEGVVRGTVVAWKDRGRADLDRLLVPAVRVAARALATTIVEASSGRPVLVVPAPSTAAARRQRARDHVRPLARAVAEGLAATGATTVMAPVLRRRGRHDQVGLGSRARGGNVALRVDDRALLRARAHAGRRATETPPNRWEPRARLLPAVTARGERPLCLLVDDVVTTGATLAAAERALEARGADVLGALVLAATPPPGSRAADRRAGGAP